MRDAAEDVRATIGPGNSAASALFGLLERFTGYRRSGRGRVRHAVHRVGCAAGLTLSRFVVKNAGYGATICCLWEQRQTGLVKGVDV